jgi:hypothetical protein
MLCLKYYSIHKAVERHYYQQLLRLVIIKNPFSIILNAVLSQSLT